MTLREAITSATTRIAQQDDLRRDAARDAELLLLHILKEPRTLLYVEPTRQLSSEQQRTYEAAVTRRITGEPIQYITAEQEFYGLALTVTPSVLIPRPETEILVEAALEWLTAQGAINPKPRVLDVGTGSGAIAIAVAKHLPSTEIAAVDLSDAALAVARGNAARHGVSHRIDFIHSDLLGSLSDKPPFDAVLSNPPYIPDSDREHLARQVREHEPETALFAGADGLDIYRRLIPQAAAALRHGGLLAMEFGYGQHQAIEELLLGWSDLRWIEDLQRIPRTVLATPP